MAPIPPATVSFHGTAIVYPAGSPEIRPLLDELGALLPTERRASASIIEIVPEGAFVTYGLGVSLAKMRDPSAARSRVGWIPRRVPRCWDGGQHPERLPGRHRRAGRSDSLASRGGMAWVE